MTTRNQGNPTTSNPGERAAFVAAVLRLSRDGRWLLHFLPGGRIVCRPLADYRRLLSGDDESQAKAPLLATRLRAYLPLAIRLAALAVALVQPLLAGSPWAEIGTAAREILGWLQGALAGIDAAG